MQAWNSMSTYVHIKINLTQPYLEMSTQTSMKEGYWQANQSVARIAGISFIWTLWESLCETLSNKWKRDVRQEITRK